MRIVMPSQNDPDDPEVDLFLMLHTMADRYGTLPAAGGIFDQDPYVVYGLSCVLAAEVEKQQMDERNKKGLK